MDYVYVVFFPDSQAIESTLKDRFTDSCGIFIATYSTNSIDQTFTHQSGGIRDQSSNFPTGG